jgi:hypothetical protein
MAKLSKKQATLMAGLINSCTAWSIAIRDELQKSKFDNAKVREFMAYHDRDGAELNAIIGVKAIILYTKEAV